MTSMPSSPLRRRPAAVALAALVACAAPLVDTVAQTEIAPSAERLEYRISLGGVVVGNAVFEVETDGESYAGALRVASDGAADLFTSALVSSEANGLVTSRGDLSPVEWVFSSQVDDDALDVTMAFGSAGPRSVVAEPPYREREWQIDPTAQFGALDPISAAVSAMFPESEADVCDRTLDIFDGRRRYHVVFKEEIRRDVRDGAVEVDCATAWRRVAGYRSRDLRKPDFELTVRFRLMDDGRALPVRAWTDTEFGGLIAVLR